MLRSNLRQFVEAAFAVRRDPARYRELARIRERGWDRCPMCSARLGLEGYRRTETRFMSEEALTCSHCGTRHLLSSSIIH